MISRAAVRRQAEKLVETVKSSGVQDYMRHYTFFMFSYSVLGFIVYVRNSDVTEDGSNKMSLGDFFGCQDRYDDYPLYRRGENGRPVPYALTDENRKTIEEREARERAKPPEKRARRY